LNCASAESIQFKSWNEEAEILEQSSIETHRGWNNNGRPKTGPLYKTKVKANLFIKFISNRINAVQVVLRLIVCIMLL